MATPRDLPRDVGAFIRDLRRNAKISLRQLAEQAGVSNPYLSQIERGLRKPSAEVLQQLATALRVSTPAMYLRAGLLDDREGQGVLAAIAVDPDLTMAQKQSLTQIYETFRRENIRLAEATAAAEAATGGPATDTAGAASGPATGGPAADTAADAAPAAEAALTRSASDAASLVNPAVTGPTTDSGTPTEAAAVTEATPTTPPARRTRVTSPRKKTPKKATAPAVEEENPS